MAKKPTTARYDQPDASALVRAEVGTQAQFNKRKKPRQYRYDSSLAPVMKSLLAYEQLGGQVQMIYMDPPYGVKFGSNFQPFVRRRDVKHNDDDFMTREPEMVKAYRDTWELALTNTLIWKNSMVRDAESIGRKT